MAIMGNVVGGSSSLGKTIILEGEDGTQIVGVVTDQEQVFNAKPSDVRIGKKAVTDSGVIEGTNTITYETTASSWLILPGENYSIPLPLRNKYDYTKIQCIITSFAENYNESVVTKAITIGDTVYSTETYNKLSDITKNIDTKSIDLNIINNSEDICEIFYFTYREIEEE